MGRTLIKLFCCLLLALPSAYADEVVESGGLEGTGTTEPTGTYTTPSVQDSSDNASKENSSAQMMSYLMGGMFIATGTPMAAQCPHSPGTCAMGIMLIGMGIMSFQQGDENGDKSGQAANTSGLTNSYGSKGTSSSGKNSSTVKAVEAQVKALETAGIVDSKTGTIKVPGTNKTYKTSDFASADAMTAAGFPTGAVAGAMDAAGRVEKAAKKKIGALTAANGYAEGGGGSSGSGSAGGLAGADYGAGLGAGAGLGGAGKLNRDPAQVAGMQKNFNGEPIGVAADSIFLMMKRRYKVKDGQDSFITDMDLTLRK